MTDGAPAHAALEPGTEAPGFTLPVSVTDVVSLSRYAGLPVILVFYPFDWSPDCGDQLVLYNEVLPEFERLGAALLAISGDSVFSHHEFARQRHLRFPLLSDWMPRHDVARRYGVFREDFGTSHRAVFVLDREHRIAWRTVTPFEVVPGADGILEALEALAEGRQPVGGR